jgi:hypothetical protein
MPRAAWVTRNNSASLRDDSFDCEEIADPHHENTLTAAGYFERLVVIPRGKYTPFCRMLDSRQERRFKWIFSQ